MFFFLLTTWFTKIPAFRNAKLADHWAPQYNAVHDHGRVLKNMAEVKNTRARPPEGEPDQPIFPLIMFSHGLGGTRTCYSSVCGEFASYGFVVCSVEHRDGSGPRTLINRNTAGSGTSGHRERSEQGEIPHVRHRQGSRFAITDFIFPKNDPADTDPQHEVDHKLRSAQLEMRLAEIEEAYQSMQTVLAGNGKEIQASNLRGEGAPGAPSHGLIGVDWKAWKGRFHDDHVIMVGHSFGAATTVEVLRHTDRFKYVSQGIVYDIWGMALTSAQQDAQHRIHAPLLMINSEAFMYWPANFKVAKSLAEEAMEQGAPCWMMTVRGTVHIAQSDFCVLYPHIASLIMKQTIDPVRAIDLNITASLEFLSRVLPLSVKPFHRALDDLRILDLPRLKELPTEHRPDEKWMAVRLRVPHELRKRLLLQGGRKKFQKWIQEHHQHEVWMHVSPTEPELRRFEAGQMGKEGVLRNRPISEKGRIENNPGSPILNRSAQNARPSRATLAG